MSSLGGGVVVENVKVTSMEKESTVVLDKKKHYFRRETKVNKKNKVLSYCEILRYMQIQVHEENER